MSGTSRGTIWSAEELHWTLQAALEVASKNELIVTAAAVAHAKQDRTPATAKASPDSTEAAVKDAHLPNAAALPTQANAAAATAAQALAPKAAETALTYSLTANVAAQVSTEEEPADAPVAEGPSSHTAASPDTGGLHSGSIAASDCPAAADAPASSGPPAPGGPTASDSPTAPTGPTAHDDPTTAGGFTAPAGPTAPDGPTTAGGATAPAGSTAPDGLTTAGGCVVPAGPTAPDGPTSSSAPDGPCARNGRTAPNGPTAPDGPTAGDSTAADGPTAPAGPPASTTKKSSKKRKQAKQPSKGAAGGTASQRKRKKPSGSQVAAGGEPTHMEHQGEAKTSVSTIDYAMAEASTTAPETSGHDGEFASPDRARARQHEGTGADSEKNWPPVANALHSKPQQHLFMPDSGPQQLRDNPKQRPSVPKSDTQQHVHEPSHSPSEHHTGKISTAAQHVGSPRARGAAPAPAAPHMQAANSKETPPAAAEDTHMQTADPTPAGLPPQQQSSVLAGDRVGQEEVGDALQQHGQERRHNTAQQPQELSQQLQQQQSKQQPEQSQGQLAQLAPGKGLDHTEDQQLTQQQQQSAVEAECQRQKDAEVIRQKRAYHCSAATTKSAAYPRALCKGTRVKPVVLKKPATSVNMCCCNGLAGPSVPDGCSLAAISICLKSQQ